MPLYYIIPNKSTLFCTDYICPYSFPVAQMVEHGASNAKIMGSIPRENKSWSNVKL